MFFTALSVFGDEGLLKLRHFYKLRNQIRSENQELFTRNQNLNTQISLLKESLYTQRVIREKLGYVKTAEYILILDEKTDPESDKR